MSLSSSLRGSLCGTRLPAVPMRAGCPPWPTNDSVPSSCTASPPCSLVTASIEWSVAPHVVEVRRLADGTKRDPAAPDRELDPRIPRRRRTRSGGLSGLTQPANPADLAVLQQTSRSYVLRQIDASGNRIGAAPIMELFDGGPEFAHGVVAITAVETVVVIVPYTVPEALTDSVRKVLRGVDLVIADTAVTADQLTADGIPAATLQSVNGPQGTLW